VITPTNIWGPYAIGACEQAMAYQVTANEEALVAMPADGRSRNAWVYSSDDSALRGPARVNLPDNLSRLAGPAADTASAPTVKPPPALVPLPVAPVAAQAPPVPAPAKPASAAQSVPRPPRAPKLSKDDASAISQELKATTKPQPRVTLDLT
jgi:hypothetical protein